MTGPEVAPRAGGVDRNSREMGDAILDVMVAPRAGGVDRNLDVVVNT